MVSHQLRCALSIRPMLLALALVGLVLPAAAAEQIPCWVPISLERESLPVGTELYYTGLSGRVVGVDAAEIDGLVAAGGEGIELREGDVLYVFFVEDAARAEFEGPARVVRRSDHEVLVLTSGDAPRLTEASRDDLRGIQQPVRVELDPIVWPEVGSAPQALPREENPLVTDMVNAFTIENFMPTWQALEDFVTRYTYAPENVLATQWMLDEFLAMGIDAEFHYYNQSGQKRNVVATIPGVGDPSRIVYITSHLDATSSTPETCAPGADDNGSGTAAVIEAARVMSQYLFEYTIKFACFNGEEQGLVGSAAYVADIAQAGEDVVACFNMDMIAYRGNDPAPPDLIIYTNSASQWAAAALEDAIQTYRPGLIDPVVLNEAIGASDHASFWDHGYHAILAIEEEAWGGDFCPWYHTCEDLIYRYPQDYVLHCAQSTMAAVAVTALPVNPEGPYFVLGGTLVDDDAVGNSNGDGDGQVNPGESIELYVTVRNIGTAAATNVSGELSTASGSVTITTSNASWNDVPMGGEGTNLTAFVFDVAGTALDGEALGFTLMMTDDTGNRDLALNFTVAAPDLAYYFHRLEDAATGNANGLIDPGETIVLPVSLFNGGGKDAADVEAVLSSGSAYVTVTQGDAGTATIVTDSAEELSPGYEVSISGAAPVGEVLDLDLSITAGAGYVTASAFKVKVGTAFYDDLEANGAWTLGAGDDDASTGLWVRVDPNGTTYDGQPCAPEDDHTPAPGTDCLVTGQGEVGGSAGGADVDGGKTTVTTPTLDLSAVNEARVAYWRWYTNNLGNNPNEDYWVVQVSNNGGGAWTDLERTTASNNAWEEHSYLISDYVPVTNQMVFRFIASDEINGSLVEAGVDDFEILGLLEPVAIDDVTLPMALRLGAARPSPLSRGTTIALALPARVNVTLRLFDVGGRLVRTLVEGPLDAGLHDVAWDGLNDIGDRVAPGIYFYELETGAERLVRRLVVVY